MTEIRYIDDEGVVHIGHKPNYGSAMAVVSIAKLVMEGTPRAAVEAIALGTRDKLISHGESEELAQEHASAMVNTYDVIQEAVQTITVIMARANGGPGVH